MGPPERLGQEVPGAGLMPKVRFDPTINAGHFLTFAGMILGALGIYTGMRVELSQVDYRIVQVEKTLAAMSAILVADARQDVRIEELARRFEELSRRVDRPGVNGGR